MEFLALLAVLLITPLGLLWFVTAHSWSKYQYRVLLNPVNLWYIPALLAIIGGFSALNRNEPSSAAPAVSETSVAEEEPVASPQMAPEPVRRRFESYQEQREREALEALSAVPEDKEQEAPADYGMNATFSDEPEAQESGVSQ